MFANYLTEGGCGERDGIGWFAGNEARGFSSQASWAIVWDLQGYQSLELFDIGRIDDDEYPDLVRADSETGECFVYRSGEDGEFSLFGLVEPGWSSSPSLCDFNLDGVLDLRTNENETEIFRGVGDGTFAAANPLFKQLYDSQTGDFIALGGPDLVGFRSPGGPALVVYPNVTGTTASVDVTDPGRARLRVTPSVSSTGVRFEFVDALKSAHGGRTSVVSIVGADGSRVRGLALARVGSGAWTADWDGCDEAGRRVPAGVYFARTDGVGSAARFTILR